MVNITPTCFGNEVYYNKGTQVLNALAVIIKILKN